MSFLHNISLLWIISASVMLGIVIGLVMRGDSSKKDTGKYCEFEP
jgi:hypothetical protein